MNARAIRRGALYGTVWGWVALLAAPLAWASEPATVGTVSLLDGKGQASRKADGGKGATKVLEVGTAIRVGDLLETGAGTRLKITLNDKSVLMLDEKSVLTIDQADFEAQTNQRKGFWASLGVGKVWAKVSKAVAGGDAKFEVRTERAVAGVRGTVFWVDAVTVVKGAKTTKNVRVQVTEGLVAVSSTQPLKKDAPKPPPGQRIQVGGPQEITRDQWEQRFAELQKGMVVQVTGEKWEELTERPEPNHAFAKFVRKNDKDE
jgi:hypothetical protein